MCIKCKETLRTKDPKWSDPSLDPAEAGAPCTGLPFYCQFKFHLIRIAMVQH
jgi:hypothetical protein